MRGGKLVKSPQIESFRTYEDGVKLMTRIRESYPKTKFILMTGFSNYSESTALEKGASRLINKPIDCMEIGDYITNYSESESLK